MAMTPAEFRVVIRWLGLRQPDVAAVLGVSERTVRHWLAGTYAIPDGARQDVEAIEAATASAVGEVVAALQDARDPAVAVYRTNSDMWHARPDYKPYPVGWWDQVVARAVSEVPGVEIGFADHCIGRCSDA